MRVFPESWTILEADTVCSEIVDCVNKTAPLVDADTGFKMIRTTNVKGGRIDLTETRFVNEATYTKWTRRVKPRRNDIVLTREAPLGEVGLLRSDDNVFLGQRTMLYRADVSKLNQIFLYYSMLGPYVQAQIRGQGNGSTVEHLRVPDAEKLKIPVAPLSDQQKIGAILSAYDDLIENNQRRIALLEKMAEELYREWFVRLRFPGHEHVKIERGVPEGWTLKPLPELIQINPTERLLKDEERPYVGMECLSTSAMYFEPLELRKGSSGSKFRNRDTLFPRITPCLENGKRGFVMCLAESEVAIGSTEFIVFREGVLPAEYIYLLSCFEPFRKHAENSMVGASGRQRVAESCLYDFLVKAPPKELLERFTSIVEPMFEEILILNRKSRDYIRLRNSLLPRLISGKLSVADLDIAFPPSMQDAVS